MGQFFQTDAENVEIILKFARMIYISFILLLLGLAGAAAMEDTMTDLR